MLSLIGGLLFLGFTLWEIRRGEADLLWWLGGLGVDITRAGNPLLFWLTIGTQVLFSLMLVILGVFSIHPVG